MSKTTSNNYLKELIEAEKQAAAIIEREERGRQESLQKAQQKADEAYASKRAQLEREFAQEIQMASGNDEEKFRALTNQTDQEKLTQQNSYSLGKDGVVDMLLHHVTTCKVELSESERQAFLAIARKNTVVNEEF